MLKCMETHDREWKEMESEIYSFVKLRQLESGD